MMPHLLNFHSLSTNKRIESINGTKTKTKTKTESIPDLQSAFLYLQHPDQVGRCILKDAEIEQNGMLELRLKRQGRNLNSDYNLT